MTYFDLIGNKEYPKKALLFKLIEFYTGKTKDQIHLQYNDEMGADVESKVIDGYRRYVDGGEPLEYITDDVGFLGNHFHIDGRALIPRPETEYMITSVVEWAENQGIVIARSEDTSDVANQCIENQGDNAPEESALGVDCFVPRNDEENKNNILIDVGTGCGVLGLSCMLLAPQAWHHAYLTDYQPQIIDLTRSNLDRHRPTIIDRGSASTIQLITASMMDWVEPDHVSLRNSHNQIVIVANLPYIPETTFDENVDESAKKWEPRAAFVGGDDGLDWYRVMFGQLFDLQSGGLTTGVTMFLEMMTRQMEILEREFGDRIQFSVTKTFHFNIIIVQGIIS